MGDFIKEIEVTTVNAVKNPDKVYEVEKFYVDINGKRYNHFYFKDGRILFEFEGKDVLIDNPRLSRKEAYPGYTEDKTLAVFNIYMITAEGGNNMLYFRADNGITVFLSDQGWIYVQDKTLKNLIFNPDICTKVPLSNIDNEPLQVLGYRDGDFVNFVLKDEDGNIYSFDENVAIQCYETDEGSVKGLAVEV